MLEEFVKNNYNVEKSVVDNGYLCRKKNSGKGMTDADSNS